MMRQPAGTRPFVRIGANGLFCAAMALRRCLWRPFGRRFGCYLRCYLRCPFGGAVGGALGGTFGGTLGEAFGGPFECGQSYVLLCPLLERHFPFWHSDRKCKIIALCATNRRCSFFFSQFIAHRAAKIEYVPLFRTFRLNSMHFVQPTAAAASFSVISLYNVQLKSNMCP